jgi:hypothetical protein
MPTLHARSRAARSSTLQHQARLVTMHPRRPTSASKTRPPRAHSRTKKYCVSLRNRLSATATLLGAVGALPANPARRASGRERRSLGKGGAGAASAIATTSGSVTSSRASAHTVTRAPPAGRSCRAQSAARTRCWSLMMMASAFKN